MVKFLIPSLLASLALQWPVPAQPVGGLLRLEDTLMGKQRASAAEDHNGDTAVDAADLLAIQAGIANAGPQLTARRLASPQGGGSGFAAGAFLDPILAVNSPEPRAATVVFWLENQQRPDPLLSARSRRTLQVQLQQGLNLLRLSEYGRTLPLINLEPIEDYRLRATFADGVRNLTFTEGISPQTLGEVQQLCSEASCWQATSPGAPGPGADELGRLTLTLPESPATVSVRAREPLPVLPHPQLIRLRLCFAGDADTPDDVMPPLRFGLQDGSGEDLFGFEGGVINNRRVAPGPGGPREYDLFALVPAGKTVHPVIALKQPGVVADARTYTLLEASLATVPPGGLEWLKTSEHRFTSIPYSSGWELHEAHQTPSDFSAGHFFAEWTNSLRDQPSAVGTHFNEEYPYLPRRVQGLRIESAGSPQHAARWQLRNILRKPETGAERALPGKDIPGKSWNKRSRLLRVSAIVRSNTEGDRIPPFELSLSGEGYSARKVVRALRQQDGTPVPAGHVQRVEFFLAPLHHQQDLSGAEDPQTGKQLDFAFRHLMENAAAAESRTVDLLNLRIDEAIIADIPSGTHYEALSAKPFRSADEDPWPEVSYPFLREQDPLLLLDTTDNSSWGNRPLPHTDADHAFFLDRTNIGPNGKPTWTMYGIFNTIPRQTNGFLTPQSPETFYSGLLRSTSRTAGAPLDRIGLPGHVDFTGARFDPASAFTTDLMIDPDQRTYFYGPWAPVIAFNEEKQVYQMIVTEHTLRTPGGVGLADDGMFLYESSTPRDVTSWRRVGGRLVQLNANELRDGRDLHFTRHRGELDAVWIGYGDEPDPFWRILDSTAPLQPPQDPEDTVPAVFTKHAFGTDPLAFANPAIPEVPLFTHHNPDGGNLGSENESPFLFVQQTEAGEKLYLLSVTKNGIYYPNQDARAIFTLDRGNRTIVYTEPVRGYRTTTLHLDTLALPVDMIGARAYREMFYEQGDGTEVYRYEVLVADGAPGGSLHAVELSNGAARRVAGPFARAQQVRPLRFEGTGPDEYGSFVVLDQGPSADADVLDGVLHLVSYPQTSVAEAPFSVSGTLANPVVIAPAPGGFFLADRRGSQTHWFRGTVNWAAQSVDLVPHGTTPWEPVDLIPDAAGGYIALGRDGSEAHLYQLHLLLPLPNQPVAMVGEIAGDAQSIAPGFNNDELWVTRPHGLQRVSLVRGQDALSAVVASFPGSGQALQDATASHTVNFFFLELNIHGSQFYWTTEAPGGGPAPVPPQNYFGWIPYYAPEFHLDHNAEGARKPWYTSFPGRMQGSGYGLRRLHWTQPEPLPPVD